MNPSNDNSFGGNMQPGGGMISSGDMQPMQPVQSISSGTGDIILAGTEKRPGGRKKLILVIAGVVLMVLAVILMIISISSGTKNSETTAADAREAFNMYANYFLTGEASKEDVELGSEVDEDMEEEVINGDEVILDENGEAVSVVEEDIVVDENADEESSYFAENISIGGDGTGGYAENLVQYFEAFQNIYLNEVGEMGAAVDMLDNYRDKLDVVVTYYLGAGLTRDAVVSAYSRGGEAEAEEMVSGVADAYGNLETAYATNFGGLVNSYGRQMVALVKKYDEYGCLINGEINYDCVDISATEASEADAEAAAAYLDEMQTILGEYENDLYTGIYEIGDIIYGEGGQNEE